MYALQGFRARVMRGKSTDLPIRTQFALAIGDIIGELSRRITGGGGSVVGGRVAMLIDTQALARATCDKPVILVTGTNGKTTTTAFIASILKSNGQGIVAVNQTGSNMPAGIVTAVASTLNFERAVFEVDERYLPELIVSTQASVVVLLNLSRDQLDRSSEVRMLSQRWHRAFESNGESESASASASESASAMTIVANCDDPLVVWGAISASRVVWVSVGLGWKLDAVGCPACGGRISFEQDHVEMVKSNPGEASESGDGLYNANHRYYWSCTCGFSRPTPSSWLEIDSNGYSWLITTDKSRHQLQLKIPGEFNVGNALMALSATECVGIDSSEALRAIESVREVVGRFSIKIVSGVRTRLLLAKNPAGWLEMIKLQMTNNRPVVVAINSRIADGKDPSWLWDVPFELLSNRTIIASGERCRDLSVRLHYANIEHQVVPDTKDAIRAALENSKRTQVQQLAASNPTDLPQRKTYLYPGALPDTSRIDYVDIQKAYPRASYDQRTDCDQHDVEFIGNYTAFNDLLRHL